MLVVNANNPQTDKNTNGVFDYIKYPDFNQFLGFLAGYQSIGFYAGNVTPESGHFPTALTVGSKVINYFFVQNRESNLFGTLSGGDIGYNTNQFAMNYYNVVGGPYTRTVRFGSIGQLKAGHTIGKSILWNAWFQRRNVNYSTESSAKLRVGLLHLDGTISYLPDIDILGMMNNTKGRTMINATTSGITSQDGDRIIVEVEIISTSSQAGGGTRILFGSLGSATKGPISDGDQSPAPIQISVE